MLQNHHHIHSSQARTSLDVGIDAGENSTQEMHKQATIQKQTDSEADKIVAEIVWDGDENNYVQNWES